MPQMLKIKDLDGILVAPGLGKRLKVEAVRYAH
jgi:hypothetical protein